MRRLPRPGTGRDPVLRSGGPASPASVWARIVRTAGLLAVPMLLAAGCSGGAGVSTTTIETPASTVPGVTTTSTAPTTTVAPTTTQAPGEVIPGVFTAALVADLTTNNPWAFLGPENSVHNGYLLGPTLTSLYSISIPGFLHVPVAAATAPPDLVRVGDHWTVTIPLEPGMTWSDGVAVTAHDFVFTVETNAEFELGSNWLAVHPPKDPGDEDLEGDGGVERWVEAVEALDEATVQISFAPSQQPPGLAVYHNGILLHPILPRHFWEPVVDGCRSQADPRACLYTADGAGAPSAGPMVIGPWEPGAFAELAANPDHFFRGVTYTVYDDLAFRRAGAAIDEVFFGTGDGAVLSSYTDGPFVGKVVLVEYGSEDAAYQALIDGEVDSVLGPVGVPPRWQEALGEEPGIETAVNPGEGFRYLAFNLRKAPMSDVAFRRALASVIDREAVIDTELSGSALPMYSLVPEANSAWHSSDIETWGAGRPPAERFESAVALLREAGYAWATAPAVERDGAGEPTGGFLAGEGMILPDGTAMPTLELLTPNDPLRATFATWIGEWAGLLGIPVEVTRTDVQSIIERAFPPQADGLRWDMLVMAWGPTDPLAPCTAHQRYFDRDADAVEAGGFNVGGYDDEEFEALSDRLDAATTIDEAREICAAMERTITEDLPYVVLFSTTVTDAWRSRVDFPIVDVLGGINGFPGAWIGQIAVSD